MKPLHIHDCEKCRYIGTSSENIDYYRCNQGPGDTIVARKTSEGSDYSSWPLFMIEGDMFLETNTPDGVRFYTPIILARFFLKLDQSRGNK